MKKRLLYFSIIALTFPLVSSAAGLVPCGGPNESACTLCHLFLMAQNIWTYLTGILAAVAIVMIIISGLIYLLSGASEQLNALAKGAMTNVAKGLLFVLGAWIMVNTLIYLVAVKNNWDDGSNLGSDWSRVRCSTTSN